MSLEEQIIVLAKTYPTISKKYGQVWCLAGVTEEGNWRRIYPVPMDIYLKIGKIPKWSLLEYDVKDEGGDGRKESRKIDPASLVVTKRKIDTEIIKDILAAETTTLEELYAKNKEDRTSLGVIKPVLQDFKIDDRNSMEKWEKRLLSMSKPVWIELIDKWLGYYFKCSSNCHGHKCMCVDSEVGNLHRKVSDKKLKDKLFYWMKSRDLLFIMGTERFYNKWIILSLFYPPSKKQETLKGVL